MALTSSHMRDLSLWEVNLSGARSGEEDQAHEGVAQDGGDLGDGLIERGIAFEHERSPCPRSPKASCAIRK